MARLAKGMDPLGLSEPDSDSDEGSEEEEDTKVVEAKKPKQVDFETLSQFGYKRFGTCTPISQFPPWK